MFEKNNNFTYNSLNIFSKFLKCKNIIISLFSKPSGLFSQTKICKNNPLRRWNPSYFYVINVYYTIRKYFWTQLTKNVEKYSELCEICQKTKMCRSFSLVITETQKTPFKCLNMDIFKYTTRKKKNIVFVFWFVTYWNTVTVQIKQVDENSFQLV